MTRSIIGILLIILGITLGVYVGFWLMFTGGIIGLIEAIKAIVQTNNINTGLIAISIAKIIFSSSIGFAVAYSLIFLGEIVIEK